MDSAEVVRLAEGEAEEEEAALEVAVSVRVLVPVMGALPDKEGEGEEVGWGEGDVVAVAHRVCSVRKALVLTEPFADGEAVWEALVLTEPIADGEAVREALELIEPVDVVLTDRRVLGLAVAVVDGVAEFLDEIEPPQ